MDIRERLEEELGRTLHRLRRSGDAVLLEEDSDMRSDSLHWADPVDEVEHLARREMSFATRSLLLQRAARLAEALERLRAGTYGICEECRGPISAGRVRAIPEAVTCVACQTRLERGEELADRDERGLHGDYEKSA